MQRTMRDRPPANHGGRIAPLHLVARKVPDWVQATCHRVSRTLRSNARLHRFSHPASLITLYVPRLLKCLNYIYLKIVFFQISFAICLFHYMCVD